MAIYSLFVLFGQSVATLLGRLYYDKGGKSKWMVTLVQSAGFPILLPFLCISPTKDPIADNNHTEPPTALILATVCFFLGIFLAADAMLYSIGLQYLPVSTFSLICASQLAFNALFSFFLKSQKFTPYIVNSLVVITISSILLVFQTDSSGSTEISKGKYMIGFLCTVGAAAGYAFILSITQLSFRKFLKTGTFRVVLEVIIFESLVATCAILVGFFASGEWKSLNREMEEFGLGKLSYVMTLVWTAVAWQVFSIGALGLIYEVSSLFCNVISTLGLPIVPVLAVIFFHDKMNGVKVVAMLSAVWGFVSYIYQHYLDDLKSKAENHENVNQVSEASVSGLYSSHHSIVHKNKGDELM
uniref:Probable purine permease n=1 Tax=Davidia involucrata TaxID=16924 RepID=A0A5B7BFP2_DAVIN